MSRRCPSSSARRSGSSRGDPTPPERATPEQNEGGRPYGGKSPAARRDDQRERILLAARDVFAERGYAAAGIEEIVARARVSRTTFYAFFENKEKCLLAVFALGIERVGGTLLKVVAETADPELDPMARIRAEVRALALAYAADPAMARILLIEIVGATPACERVRVQARDYAARVIAAQLEQYEYWAGKSQLQRRVASLATMAAIDEPLASLVAEGRLDEWETLVEPISEFVGRGLIAPVE